MMCLVVPTAVVVHEYVGSNPAQLEGRVVDESVFGPLVPMRVSVMLIMWR